MQAIESRGMSPYGPGMASMHQDVHSPSLQYGVQSGPSTSQAEVTSSLALNGNGHRRPLASPSRQSHDSGSASSLDKWRASGQLPRPVSAGSYPSQQDAAAAPLPSNGKGARPPSVLDPARSAPSPPPPDLLHYHADPPPWSGGYARHPPPIYQSATAPAAASSPDGAQLQLGALMQNYGSGATQPHQAYAAGTWASSSSQSSQQGGGGAGLVGYGVPGMLPMPAGGSPHFLSHSQTRTPSASPSATRPKKGPKAQPKSIAMSGGGSGSGSGQGAPGGPTLVAPIYNEDGSIQRRGGVRQQIACHSCRARKSKCDGERPCRHCSRRGTECTYEEVPRRRGPGRKRKATVAAEADPVHAAHIQLVNHAAAAAAANAANNGRLAYPYAAPTGLTHPNMLAPATADQPSYAQHPLSMSQPSGALIPQPHPSHPPQQQQQQQQQQSALAAAMQASQAHAAAAMSMQRSRSQASGGAHDGSMGGDFTNGMAAKLESVEPAS